MHPSTLDFLPVSSHRALLATAGRHLLRDRRTIGYALVSVIAMGLWTGRGTAVVGSGFGSAITDVFSMRVYARFLDALAAPVTERAAAFVGLLDLARANGVGATVGLAVFSAAVALLLALLLAAIVVSANALVRSTADTVRGERTPRMFRVARQRIGNAAAVLGMVALADAILLAAWSSTLNAALSSTSAAATVVAVVVCVLVLLGVAALHILAALALVTTVVEHVPPRIALRRAFAALVAHRLLLIETSLLLTAIQFIGTLAGIIVNVVVALPFLFAGGIGIAQGVAWLPVWATNLGVVSTAIAVAIVAAATLAYTVTAWALLALRLMGPEPAPRPWLDRYAR